MTRFFTLLSAARSWRWMAAWAMALPMVQAQPVDPLLDFRFFKVPQERKHMQSPWGVRWLVRADAQSYCQEVSRKDGHTSRSEGCAFWVLGQGQGQCTVVTTDSTTHSQLGHLYLACLNAP